MYDTIRLETEGPVCWLTLARPEKRNAINLQMTQEFHDALQEFEDDDSARVMIIKGDGPTWSAGHDLYEEAKNFLSPGFKQKWLRPRRRTPEVEDSLLSTTKPIIAAIHGFCGPAALMVATCCDLVLAEQGTTFSFEQIRAGGASCFPLLLLTLGEKRTKELHLLGRAFSAEEAERRGLINAVVPGADLYNEARKWALEIAAIPAAAVTANKLAINSAVEIIVSHSALYRLSRGFGAMSRGSEFEQTFYETVVTKGLPAALEVRDADHGGRGSYTTEVGQPPEPASRGAEPGK